jgi:MFS family permease
MRKEITLLIIINMLYGMSYSIISSLFPILAIRKGIPEYIIGFNFSCFGISNILVIPVSLKLINKYGRIKMMNFSLAMEVNFINL